MYLWKCQVCELGDMNMCNQFVHKNLCLENSLHFILPYTSSVKISGMQTSQYEYMQPVRSLWPFLFWIGVHISGFHFQHFGNGGNVVSEWGTHRLTPWIMRWKIRNWRRQVNLGMPIWREFLVFVFVFHVQDHTAASYGQYKSWSGIYSWDMWR